MQLETANFISELNPLWPLGTEGLNTADDHSRVTKKATQQSFPNVSGEVSATQQDLNLLAGAAINGSGLNPVGTVIQGFWTSAPDGYYECNGDVIDPTKTDLIAIVGPNTPDLRGQFMRGWSDNAAVDPDGPRAPLDSQADEVGPHTHEMPAELSDDPSGNSHIAATNKDSERLDTFDNTGDETRPVNIAVFFAIKW